MIKFVSGKWSGDIIQKVEVERETESSVWIKGSRSNKITDYLCYFDSWGLAKFHLLEKAYAKVDRANYVLKRAEEELSKVEAIKPPLSNCCSAPIHENTDICSECKEHCEGD